MATAKKLKATAKPASGSNGHSASNGGRPVRSKNSRKRAAASALASVRAEGLEPSAEHEALAARWVAGEIDNAQFRRLNLEQVRQRLVSGGRALIP
jgi:Antitoxin VbhA